VIRKILVPLDGSKLAEKALPYAESFAKKFEAELILVWVLQPQPIVAMSEYGAISYAPMIDQEQQERRLAYKYLCTLRDQLRKQEIVIRTAVIKGKSVADAIVDIAEQEKVDFIVKTSYGRSGLSRWLYGSVAVKMLERTSCPLFLVKVKDEDKEEVVE
jgi:nucleotide-binding universal stress UspA family protein